MNSVFYVGMDVHKETISVTVFDGNRREPSSESVIKNNQSQIAKYFKRLQSKNEMIICCYEAGPTGFTLHRFLENLGITCYVVAPTLLPRKPGDRIKTDKRDALLLAKALRNEEIVPIYVPRPSDEAVRDYLRMCSDMKAELKRQKQHLVQFLLRIGMIYQGKTSWTRDHHRWLTSLNFDLEIHKQTFDEYYFSILSQEERILRILEKIDEIAATAKYCDKVSKLRCFKGVGNITALSFIVEIGDFRRFPNAKSFMAYMGLVPSEYSSGGSRRVGSITKAGNTHLRRLLIEAGWHYRKYSPTKKNSK